MNFEPLGNRILVKPDEENAVSAGGVVLPDSITKERPQEAEVIKVGTVYKVQKGDIVYFSKFGGTEVSIDGDEYLILRESDLLGRRSA